MIKPTIYVASAGTGKTTALVSYLSKIIKEGVRPQEILFTTFTNAGAQEIIKRTLEAVPNLSEKDFPLFRTLHSVSYRNIPRKQMLRPSDYFQLAKLTGYSITGKQTNSEDGTFHASASKGDMLLQLNTLMRARQESAEETAVNQVNTNFSAEEIQKFDENYKKFRNELDKYDFTDQLEVFLQSLDYGSPFRLSDVIVDESQDMTPLQWSILHKLQQINDSRMLVAGDDKQSIYAFTGADPNSLINLDGTRIVLDTTYRVPSEPLKYAEKIASRITRKQKYEVRSKTNGGSVQYITALNQVDMSSDTWFLLVRNRFLMGIVESMATESGFAITTDNPNSPFSPKRLEAIRLWKELIAGFEVAGESLKQLIEFLPSKKAIKYGFIKKWDSLHNDVYYDWDALNKEYGLITEKPWHDVLEISQSDKEALMVLDKKGELSKKPRITVSTIHGVKGREADNVVVFPDITQQTEKNYLANPDDEHRAFYVATTRTKKNLYLHAPFTNKAYPL